MNIANGLTVLRLLLVPVFALALFARRRAPTRPGGSCAFVVFAVASVTDRLDGDLARRRGLVTDFGKIADPIADKALTGTALVGLSAARRAAVVGDRGHPGPRAGRSRCCGSG